MFPFKSSTLLPQDPGFVAVVFYIRYKMQMHWKAQESLKLTQKEARKMENSLYLSDERESVMLNVGLVDKPCVK